MELFFNPRSVLLVGVSRQTGVGAYNGLEMMLRFGYRGKIFVVHPQAGEILGHKAYSRIRDLPEAPDLAVIALARDRVVHVIEDCLAKGIRRYVIISQGFADADDKGRKLQARLTALAKEHNARIVGPNTMGVMNNFTGFTTAFVDVPRVMQPPRVTLIAQSGAPQVGSESFTGPLGKAVDIGNACDVGFEDLLEYLERDPETEVIALHMEGLVNGRRFLEVAARLSRAKPIVVLKTGRSEAGARAALSHTASMVGADDVFSAAFERAGVMRAANAQDLLDTIQALRKLPPLKGPRIGIATPSGALGIIALDALAAAGLQPGRLPQAVKEAVEPLGPYWHRLHNPVDLWPIGMKTGDFLKVAKETIAGFLADPEIDGVMAMLPGLSSPLHRNNIVTPEFVASLNLERFGKPLVLAFYGDYRDELNRNLARVEGVACYFSVEQAAHGLARLHQYHLIKSVPAENLNISAPAPGKFSHRAEQNLLGEAALEFLSAYGIPTVPGALCQSAGEAADLARELGYPVVLKVIAPEWLHKSDKGGVVLNLSNDEEVRRAFNSLQEKVQSDNAQASLEGILVQKQAQGRELLLGVKQDATFGPVMVCGLGGVYTEIWRDTAQTLAPLSMAQSHALLAKLRSYRLLTGFRGEPPVDLDAVAQALANLSRLAVEHPELQECDINPLIASPAGCWAVDARIIRKP
ncbi:MAG: acetate--CoA ligase family protein [Deltaproteobacteria bacterium]|nr:acetate--CoA ligase family protein [Deltaproteobacteria bacterium]